MDGAVFPVQASSPIGEKPKFTFLLHFAELCQIAWVVLGRGTNLHISPKLFGVLDPDAGSEVIGECEQSGLIFVAVAAHLGFDQNAEEKRGEAEEGHPGRRVSQESDHREST